MIKDIDKDNITAICDVANRMSEEQKQKYLWIGTGIALATEAKNGAKNN